MRTSRALWLVAGALALAGRLPAQGQDISLDPIGGWNNYRVYVSPAVHDDAGRRGECQSANENALAFSAASAAGRGPLVSPAVGVLATALRERGYQVRIGRGTVTSAIRNSNAWGADLHLVLHSNSRGITGGCGSTAKAQFGTNVIYRVNSIQGRQLAQMIASHLGPASPGTNDYVCHNPGHTCTTIDLGELRKTGAVAAYSESEFHDWNVGVAWLTGSGQWARHLVDAVDEFLKYPRA